ncbi:MAG: hypothetical protein AAGL49_09305 [Pseudomonadota bacterium]
MTAVGFRACSCRVMWPGFSDGMLAVAEAFTDNLATADGETIRVAKRMAARQNCAACISPMSAPRRPVPS